MQAPTLTPFLLSTNADYHRSVQGWKLAFAWLCLMGVTGLIGLSMMRGGPDPAWIGWLIYILGGAAILLRPWTGLPLTLFFSLAGDGMILVWYPFNKNFSSGESIFYVNNALIFSPLEFYLMLMVLVVAVRCFAQRRLALRGGPLGVPMALFTVMMVVGMGYGIVRGGSLTIGLWECRPMFYLTLLYFLGVNLLEDRRQINVIAWAAVLGNLVQAIAGNYFFLVELKGSLDGYDRIMEHSSSIHLNFLFVLTMGVWLYRASWPKRLVLPLISAVGALAYLANQRRASFVTLAVALMLMGIALYRQNRRAFWMIAPAAAVIGVVYVAAFWNSSGTLGMPARGIKSVFAPDGSDAESNIYRVIENINTDFTIHQVPIFGVGFGNKFYTIVALPDISFFEWWEYITHNSVVWVWMKTGVFGFISMIFMVGTTLAVGARAYDRIPDGDYKAIGLALVLYVLMHFVYAYVDMSWDTQSMTFVGVSAAVLGSMERLMASPPRIPPLRYPWQLPRLAPIVIEEDPA